MATNSTSGGNEVFDVRKIRRFVELMNEHELSEIDLRQGEQRIRLRRGPELITGTTAVSAIAPESRAPLPETPAEKPATSPSEDSAGQYVTSPMVGTFYTAATPEAAAFAKVGDQVGPETTVCILEAMKVFNEIPAGCAGKIVAVLVENGDAVEFGQKLFKVGRGCVEHKPVGSEHRVNNFLKGHLPFRTPTCFQNRPSRIACINES